MTTPAFGLLGQNIAYSRSPQLHALFGNSHYARFDVNASDMEALLASTAWRGLNVTIPYKTKAFSMCDEVSDAAKRTQSVNTLYRLPDGRLFGDNTDWVGFETLLNRFESKLTVEESLSRNALVLGTGGAARTAKAVLESHGYVVVLVSRRGPFTYDDLPKARATTLIVNATPVGTLPALDETPVAKETLSSLPRLLGVIDLIYAPKKTRLLLDAESLGLQAINGLGMLVGQGLAAHTAWGLPTPIGGLEAVEAQLQNQSQHVAIVGMPGSGKTTLGRALAETLNRPFVDTDEEITAKTGKTPADWIRERGEAHFREVESQILCDVLGRVSPSVVATGGGVVTVPKNLDYLKGTSYVYYLTCALEALALGDRPLSQRAGVEALFRVREPYYLAAADEVLAGDETHRVLEAMLPSARRFQFPHP